MKRVLIALSLIVLLYSCGEQKAVPIESPLAFQVPSPYLYSKHELVTCDYNNDGYDDVLLIVRDTNVAARRPDSVHCFVFLADLRQWQQQCSFAIEDYEHTEIVHRTPKSTATVAFYTFSGGTSITTSRGLQLYEYHDSCLVNVLTLNEGNPHVEVIDSIAVVIHHDSFSTFFNPEDAIEYVDSIFAIGHLPSPANEMKRAYFEREAARQKLTLDSTLQQSKTSASGYATCYEAAVKRVMALTRLGRTQDAMNCVRDTKRRAPRMPQLYKDALDHLIDGR